ncbi:MAG TPA: pyridoxine 5'-phosphate oxidase C-terminal domain-containing protein, partial [Acidimicrobiia bacterium]
PTMVEFWQGQPNRFHDRVRYVKQGEDWSKERLAP